MDDEVRSRYRVPKAGQSPPAHQPAQPAPTVRPHPRPAHRPQAHPQPSPPPDRPNTQPRQHPAVDFRPKVTKKPRRRVRKVLIALILLGSLGGGGLYAYPRFTSHNPFSPAIRGSFSIPLYYPQKLPAGYAVDISSIHTTVNELVYNANNGSSRLVFTMQKIPQSFDFNLFYTKQLSNITRFETAYGQAAIGKNDNRNLGSLVSDKTWLLLTTNSQQASVDDMSLILKNLKQY